MNSIRQADLSLLSSTPRRVAHRNMLPGWSLWMVAVVPWLGLLAGCGSPPAPPAAGKAEPGKSTADAAAVSTAEETEAAPKNRNVRTDAAGRKWIGDIPYDVFFDDPLAVAANTTPVAGAAPAAAAPAMAAATPMPESPPAATPEAVPAGGALDWQSLVTMEQVNNETKRIRNHLTSSLQSLGTYNGNNRELQVDGAVIAALALVVAQHPEEVSWKSNSRFLREYGEKLNETAAALGRESYSSSQVAAEGIEAVLNGNVPADAGDPAATEPFGEAAKRAGVMKRIEKASEWMRANINSEAVFKKELDGIKQEASMIAVLAQIIADESYDSASEPDYQKFAKNLLEGAKAASTAADEKSYPAFGEAINKVTKACAECHASYGNG